MSATPPKKSDGLLRPVLVVFAVTLVCYLAFFHLVEKRRVAQSPWLVSMEADAGGTVRIVAQQQSLKLGPLEIVLAGAATNALPKTNLVFATPNPFPRALSAGEIKFEDLTFLPGTVAMRIGGTDIQILRRTLTVGTNEIPWSGVRSIAVVSNRVVRLEK